MSDNIEIVKFIETVGDIPCRAVGFFKKNIGDFSFNRTRVFILREYLDLKNNELPCYNSPIAGTPYTVIQEKELIDEQRESLNKLIEEIDKRITHYVGPDMIVTIMRPE